MFMWFVFLRFAYDFLTDFRTMAEVFCVCGQWSSKESLQWEFNLDTNSNASFIYIEEDLQYEDLVKMVSKDFVGLGLEKYYWRFSPNLHRKYSSTHKFHRQIRSFNGICRLCVKVCCFVSNKLFRKAFLFMY